MSGPHKSPNFRPSVTRAVYLTGVIDQTNAANLVREIIPLLGQADEPITLYMDSPGGSTYFAENIYRTLKLQNQDTGESHRVITVALGMAASASCDLLIAGDYALVHPHSILLCHGVRQSGDGIEVTRETASMMARNLASSNERYALEMAGNAISRFIFRFVTARHTFEAIRLREENANISDASCFLLTIEPHVSNVLMDVLSQAMINHLQNELLDTFVMQEISKEGSPSAEDHVAFEAFLLKCIIEYEARNAAKNPGWTFRSRGLPQLEGKLEILLNSHDESHNQQIRKLIARWGELLLNEEDLAAYAAISQADKEAWLESRVMRTLRSLWFLLVAICRLLQENENYISAEEAYWIGLVDEIIGRTDLPNPRILVEFAFE